MSRGEANGPEPIDQEIRKRLARRLTVARAVVGESDAAAAVSGGGSAAAQLTRFARALFAAPTLEHALTTTVEMAMRIVPGAEQASITMPDRHGRLRTVAASGQLARRLDELQYQADEGPCVARATMPGANPLSSADLGTDGQWPTFGPAAARAGVRSALSAGMFPEAAVDAPAPAPLAALNLYASGTGAFSEGDVELAILVAGHAAVAIAGVAALDNAESRADQLAEALTSRDVIGQAKGILMERHKITEGDAFQQLRGTSTRLNVKLRDLAETVTATGELPEGTSPAPPGAGTPDHRLRQIESLSDTALAQLDTDELLVELLDRTCDVLGVDTSAVLLLDSSGTHLVATAAHGLEQEVEVGVRIPVGRGFTGRIVAEQRPMILRKVTPDTVFNPILVEKGIKALLGVPLMASGIPLGVVHVGSLKPRAFTPAERDLLQQVADRIALAVRAQRTSEERAAARTLANSLLPGRLPTVGGLELAARYLPDRVGGVGGDWYDVLPLRGDRVGVVIGDVAGHGLSAAVVMGRMRSALRAYALLDEDPATVLERLDRKMQHFEPGPVATVAYGIFSPDREHLTLSLAGHLPPALAHPNQPTDVPELAADPPIGVTSGLQRNRHELEVPAGSLLCFFTDGLVTRRGSSIAAGLRRLQGVLTVGGAEVTCATVMTRMLESDRASDDVAVLVVRRPALV